MSVNALAGKATRIDSDKLKLVDWVSQYIFELLFNDLNQANTYYNNTIINSFDHDILNALNENLISLFLKAYENKRLTNDYKENLFQNLHELLNDEWKDSLTSKMLSFWTNESQTFVSYSKNEFNLKDRLKKNRWYPFAFTTAIYCIFSFTNNWESNAATLPTKTESISPKHNLKKNNTIEIKNWWFPWANLCFKLSFCI